MRQLILLAIVGATSAMAHPIVCWEVPIHTWVRHQDSTSGNSCSGNIPFTNTGFNYKTANADDPHYQSPGCSQNGVMEDDQNRLYCYAWNNFDSLSVSQSCSAVATLAESYGWGCTTYNLEGVKLTCDIFGPGYSPKGENVCWSFTCAFANYVNDTYSAKQLTPRQAAAKMGNKVPKTWTCPLAKYNGGDGCDCNCGGWDPDCEDITAPTTDCGDASLCLPTGCAPRAEVMAARKLISVYKDGATPWHPKSKRHFGPLMSSSVGVLAAAAMEVASPITPPSAWHCPAHYYNANDGCDCECGAVDPDCTRDPSHQKVQPVVGNCPYDFKTRRGATCSSEGKCVAPK